MIDIVDTPTLSRMMVGNRPEDTKPELILRIKLHVHGLRYRLRGRKLHGTPDLGFRWFGAVCYLRGYFWVTPCRLLLYNRSRDTT